MPGHTLWGPHHPVFSVPLCRPQAIITALGVDRRNRVLAGLYMGRSDTQLVVRQASLHVWKIVVSNTPRTLREILPTLFGLLLGFLASTCADKRTVSFLGLVSDLAAPEASFQRLERWVRRDWESASGPLSNREHVFIYLVIQRMLIQQLLCAKQGCKTWDVVEKEDSLTPCPHGATVW